MLDEIKYSPEAKVSIGEETMGTDFAEAVVRVTAKIVHYGQRANKAKVVVTLTPAGGGASVVKEFEIGGDFDVHEFDAVFDGLTAGGCYAIAAKVVMDTDEEAGLKDGEFVAARKFTWFNESATSFSAAKWTGAGTTVKVEDGCLSVVNDKDGTTTFMPGSRDISATRVVIKVRECDCYADDALPDPSGPAAVAVVAGTGDMLELVAWGDGKWNKTGVEFADETVNADVFVDLDFHRHVVRYGVAGRSLGTYSLPNTIGSVSYVAFKGYSVLSELAGIVWDANLVADTNGVEYANYTVAKEESVTGALSPLWLSTWNLAGDSGKVDVNDPKGLITFTGESKVLKSETNTQGIVTHWYAKADPADIGAGGHAEKYIETTVQLGLAQAITDSSVVKIDGFAVADGSMTFKVEVGQEEVAKAAIISKVEISETLDAGWRNPDTDEIAFDATKHEITVTPKSKADPAQKSVKSFLRIRIPFDS